MAGISKGDGLWGDALLYYGIMSQVHEGFIPYAETCQTADGRIWRNPGAARAGVDYINSCSRDMMAGFLLVANADRAGRLLTYIQRNEGKLCANATDNRNRVGWLGELELWAKSTGARWVYPIVAAAALLEILFAWKGYQMHLGLVALLRCRREGYTGWFYRQALKVAAMRSGNNFIVAYLRKDVKTLTHQLIAIRGEQERGQDYADVWPAATFQPWRANRMAHPLAREFIEKAIDQLVKEEQQ